MSHRHTSGARPRRRGFTLAEIVVALMILGIIGAALVRLILVQSRFAEVEMGKRNARTVSRNAMNIMLTDLRMAQDNGSLVAASSDSITLRVPVAFGLLCTNNPSPVISLMPVDSSMMSMAKYAGWAYRDSTTGVYTYKDANSVVDFSSLSTPAVNPCTDTVAGPGILPITYGTRSTKVVQMNDNASGSPNPGWPAFVYQYITYQFAASGTYSGRIGLYRKRRLTSTTSASDEIIAPFDSTARFKFIVLNSEAALTTPPADLNTVRGLELNLAGASQSVARNTGATIKKGLVTAVYFKNRRDP